MSAWTWNATDDGYEASDGRARLVKRPKGGRSRKFDWFLVLPSGAEHALPGRASFDHAERLLAALKG